MLVPPGQCGAGRSRRRLRSLILAVVTLLAWLPGVPAAAGNHVFPDIAQVAVESADCDADSLPEPGLQGDVSAEDRLSGRSTLGYRCNIRPVGSFVGAGGGIVSAVFEHCSYTGSLFPGNNVLEQPGVQIIDAADPANPRLVGSLTEPAMRGGTWETLKVNTERKLLAATSVPLNWGGGFFSIYDISDCERPRLLNPGPGTAFPLPFTSHEGGFSPDGRTYWASGVFPGHLSAIDVSDPAVPQVIWQGLNSVIGHGFGITPDGNTMYISNMAGVTVLDIGAVQRRDPYPRVPHVAAYLWPDGQLNQHSIPVTIAGRAHIVTPDEGGSGGVRIFDVGAPDQPRQVAQVKLEINLPENLDTNFRSSMGGSLFSSNPHYCTVDRPADPTALACSWESSGIRVFDITDLESIREIGYFNPPAATGTTVAERPNSAHVLASIIGFPAVDFLNLGMAAVNGRVDPLELIGPRSGMIVGGDMSTDWCLSPPVFRGNQIWTTRSDTGFHVLELSPGVYTPPADQETTIGS